MSGDKLGLGHGLLLISRSPPGRKVLGFWHHKACCQGVVCTENLNPDVMVMKSAKDCV